MRNITLSSALGICALAAATAIGFGAHLGRANIIQYVATGTGASTGDASMFHGSATFVFNTGTGTVSITLDNTTSPTYSAGDLLHGVSFDISGTDGGSLATATFSSVAGNLITVDSAGAISADGSATLTNTTGTNSWDIGTDTATSLAIGTGSIANIIGPPTSGNYSAANSSIKANHHGHSDFLQDSPTFVLDIPGLVGANNLTMTSATIYYTTGGVAASTNWGPLATVLPEPAAFSLLSIPVLGLLLRKRRVA